MTTTMLYTTGISMEEPSHRFSPTTVAPGKPRHRPKALQIQPLDSSELSAKLNDISVEHEGQPRRPVHTEDSLRPPLSATSMGALSPRTIQTTHTSPSIPTPVSSRLFRKEKTDDKLSSPLSAKPPRRGSFFDAFRFRGSNYSDETQKQTEEDVQKPARYRHVPQVAAQQFARTTTVEPLTQKASPKGMRPAPGPHSMNNGTISLQEYNSQYRRAQSLCSGRPTSASNVARTGGTELDKVSTQRKRQTARNSMLWNVNGPELSRRMSTGNMQPLPQPGRDLIGTSVGGFQGNAASSARRGSASSSGFSDASPFVRESGPATPFKQEFGINTSPNRRGSETSAATSGSRRGSFVNIPNPQHAAEIHRVDWSQSDQPVKVRRDSKWGGLKHRKTSLSQQKPSAEDQGSHFTKTSPQSSISPKSPKSGFLKRFMH
ncbi:hypothetical protein LB506_000921 [Fusarium annulatum]|nr:hypothetical protein LB506_000921 [Fusarium annulatum]